MVIRLSTICIIYITDAASGPAGGGETELLVPSDGGGLENHDICRLTDKLPSICPPVLVLEWQVVCSNISSVNLGRYKFLATWMGSTGAHSNRRSSVVHPSEGIGRVTGGYVLLFIPREPQVVGHSPV